MTKVSFPARPEDLDAAWLEDALRCGGVHADARVRGVRAERIGEGYGWDARIDRLWFDGDGVPPTLVAKRGKAATVAVEARFARDVAPRLPIANARVVLSRTDEASGQGLLLLEDVKPAKQGDHLVGATDAEVESVVDAMAAAHAAFWARTDDPAVAWLPRWKLGEGREDRLRRTAAAAPLWLERRGGATSPEARAMVEALPERLAEALAALDASPRTAIHADLHFENVLFRPDGTPVVLDWADASLGAGAVDLAWVLVFTKRATGPRAVRDALAARYVAGLRARGVLGYGVERLTRDTAHAAVSLFALVVRNAASRDFVPPPHPRVAGAVELERACAAEGAATLRRDWL